MIIQATMLTLKKQNDIYLTFFYLKILNINLELTFNLQDVLVITGHLAITDCIHLPSNRVLD